MKKILAVFLAAIMICSAFSVLSFAAENEYPAPAAPENLALTADGIASWDAVEVPAYTESDPDKYDTTVTVSYKVSLSRWDYDSERNTWSFTTVSDEIVTTETSVDFSEYMVSGKYIFSVTATAEYTRTLLSNGKMATFKKISDPAALDRADAVQVTQDIFADPIDTSIPFESLVDENDETATGFLKILKKIKEVFIIILRFLGFAGEKTGISEEIRNK